MISQLESGVLQCCHYVYQGNCGHPDVVRFQCPSALASIVNSEEQWELKSSNICVAIQVHSAHVKYSVKRLFAAWWKEQFLILKALSLLAIVFTVFKSVVKWPGDGEPK